jgi:hypothetical protein
MPGGLHPPPSVILEWTELASQPHSQHSAGRHGIVAMSCVLTVLAILVVMARLRARWLRKNFDWDDGLLLVAMVCLSSLRKNVMCEVVGGVVV